MTKKTKYRKGHYIVKGSETYHIVKGGINRISKLNTWSIFREVKNGDGILYDYNGNKIYVDITGCGSWVDHAFDNTYKTLVSAVETLDSVIAYKKSLR